MHAPDTTLRFNPVGQGHSKALGAHELSAAHRTFPGSQKEVFDAAGHSDDDAAHERSGHLKGLFGYWAAQVACSIVTTIESERGRGSHRSAES